MFAGRPTVIGITRFEHVRLNDDGVIAYRGLDAAGDTVVEFPASVSYLLIAANRMSVVTPLEAAQRDKDEQNEMEKVFGKPDPRTGEWPSMTGDSPPEGRPGQYL